MRRVLRSETRLATTLATAPSANSSRALAMSTCSVSTGVPTARTSTSGGHQRQDDVDVVDHQVGDHVDVGGALGEAAHALGLDVARGVDALGQGHDAGVEALQMADLQDDAGGVGQADDLGAFGRVDGDGLLQQHVHAALEERRGDLQMGRGRHDDADGIDLRRSARPAWRRRRQPASSATACARAASTSTTPTSSTSGRRE
jgi:hypothetical protein